MDTVCVTMQRSARDAPLGFRLVGVHAPFRVDAVVPGSPAAAAGVQERDVLLAINGADMTASLSLPSAVHLINGLTDLQLSLKLRRPQPNAPSSETVPALAALQLQTTSSTAAAEQAPAPPSARIDSPRLGRKTPGSPLPLPRSRRATMETLSATAISDARASVAQAATAARTSTPLTTATAAVTAPQSESTTAAVTVSESSAAATTTKAAEPAAATVDAAAPTQTTHTQAESALEPTPVAATKPQAESTTGTATAPVESAPAATVAEAAPVKAESELAPTVQPEPHSVEATLEAETTPAAIEPTAAAVASASAASEEPAPAAELTPGTCSESVPPVASAASAPSAEPLVSIKDQKPKAPAPTPPSRKPAPAPTATHATAQETHSPENAGASSTSVDTADAAPTTHKILAPEHAAGGESCTDDDVAASPAAATSGESSSDKVDQPASSQHPAAAQEGAAPVAPVANSNAAAPLPEPDAKSIVTTTINPDAKQPQNHSPPAKPPSPRLSPPPLIADIGLASLCGVRHGTVNQDRAYHDVVPLPHGQTAQIAAVFDGHGLLGEQAAEVAVETLRQLTRTVPWALLMTEPQAFMSVLFAQLNAAVTATHDKVPSHYSYTSGSTTLDFVLQPDADPELGDMYVCPDHPHVPPRPIDFGCTAVVAIALGRTLVIGNCGDAAAVLIQRDMPGCEDQDGFHAEIVTGKHTATEAAEQERINHDFPRAAVFTPDGYLAPTDPSISQYELQLTRSLGHRLLRQAGVVATPDTFASTMNSEHSYAVVLCSDGLIDELRPADIASRVAGAVTAQEAADTLCNDAQSFCMDSSKVDDTTALVVRFRY